MQQLIVLLCSVPELVRVHVPPASAARNVGPLLPVGRPLLCALPSPGHGAQCQVTN
jgi:hypothetical protein